jgi:P27 family predicted phage terminase small subunit
MGARSPKPHLTKTKQARSARPVTEPKIKKRSLFQIPKNATEKGRWLYKKLGEAGISEKLLAEVDSAALILYCETWSRWWEAHEKSSPQVYKTKSGNPAVNPQVWIANALAKTLVKLGSELGMTPVGRAKMAIEMQNSESDWDEYVKRKRDRLAEIANHIGVEDED